MTFALKTYNKITDTDDDLGESDTDDDTIEGNNEVTDTNAEQYYTSGVWEQKVDNILTGIEGTDQPKHANAQASHAHNQPQSSTVEIHSLPQHLLINPSSSDRVISWHFPPQYSQSTLTGQLCSNACTFIALSYSKLYFSSPETINSSQPLSNT